MRSKTLARLVSFAAAFAALLLHAAPEAQARRLALIIANSTYEHASVLPNPRNDANVVEAALREVGFDSVTVFHDLDARAMESAFEQFRAGARGADIALVYYAGHGVESDGENWLVPVSAGPITEVTLSQDTVSSRSAVDATRGARLGVIVLDACRNSPLDRLQRPRSLPRGLAPNVVANDGTIIMYSTAPGQVALDGSRGDVSPFASAFVRHLRTPDLEVEDFARALNSEVRQSTGGRQRPYVSASLPSNPFFLGRRVAADSSRRVERSGYQTSAPFLSQLSASVRSSVLSALTSERAARDAAASARRAQDAWDALLSSHTTDVISMRPAPGHQYIGQSLNGVPHGLGILTVTPPDAYSGARFVGEWRDGIRNGYGINYMAENERRSHNSLAYEGQYSGYGPHGYGVWTWLSGASFAGRFNGATDAAAGSAQGRPGVLLNPNGTMLVGVFSNSGNLHLQGFGALFDERWRVIEAGFYEDGRLVLPESPVPPIAP